MTNVKSKKVPTSTETENETQQTTTTMLTVDPSVFVAPTMTEKMRLAKTLRKTPVGAIRSGLQNRLIQILEYDIGLKYKPVSSIQGQPAGPLGDSELAPKDLRPEECTPNLYTGTEMP